MQVDKLPPTCCPFPYPLHSGNALLIGVGGSGKASLARFAAFVAGLEFVAVEARRGYGAAAFQEDVKRVYKVCVGGGCLGTTPAYTQGASWCVPAPL